MNEFSDWLIYQGTGEPHDGKVRLPPPPPWRHFDGQPVMKAPEPNPEAVQRLGSKAMGRWADDDELLMVNAALYLRRPLLVTGRPGIGKTSLAYRVARELRLGPVLRWRITSRSTLQDGLYRYDPLARLEDASHKPTLPGAADSVPWRPGSSLAPYIRLGPLGTALLPWCEPRVLLIDNLDKGDIDLPDDLVDVMEEGEFDIPELKRLTAQPVTARLRTDDDAEVTIEHGKVRCHAFPFVVITTYPRSYSPGFLRPESVSRAATRRSRFLRSWLPAGIVERDSAGSSRKESHPVGDGIRYAGPDPRQDTGRGGRPVADGGGRDARGDRTVRQARPDRGPG